MAMAEQMQLPQLPEYLKQQLIDFCHERYELYKKNFWPSDDPWQLSGIGYTVFPKPLFKLVWEFCEDTWQLSGNRYYSLQIVTPGRFLSPHIDDPVNGSFYRLSNSKKKTYCSLNYLLSTGGEYVTTSWWRFKDEYKHHLLKQGRPDSQKTLSLDKIERIERHVLNKDRWYNMQLDEIHSVENVQTLRTALIVRYNNE
jgi:hypothetical protein